MIYDNKCIEFFLFDCVFVKDKYQKADDLFLPYRVHLNIKYKVEDLIVYIQNIIWQ